MRSFPAPRTGVYQDALLPEKKITLVECRGYLWTVLLGLGEIFKNVAKEIVAAAHLAQAGVYRMGSVLKQGQSGRVVNLHFVFAVVGSECLGKGLPERLDKVWPAVGRPWSPGL